MTELCQACGSKDIIIDYEKGEDVWINCGPVITNYVSIVSEEYINRPLEQYYEVSRAS